MERRLKSQTLARDRRGGARNVLLHRRHLCLDRICKEVERRQVREHYAQLHMSNSSLQSL